MRVLLAVFTALAFFIYTPFVYSATLVLERIGALDLGGNIYAEWWYSGTNPVFSGKASPSSVVSISVGESSYSATADAAGVWSTSTTHESGDYNVEIIQGEEKLVFVLHLGQTMPAGITSDGTDAVVPDTGYSQAFALIFGVGVMLLGGYYFLGASSNNKAALEKRILEE